MNRMNRLTLAYCAVLLLTASTALAGGFLIYEHGARATGMASSRTAMADDISALYYNPAAITELEGLQLQLGMTGIMPFLSYDAAFSDGSYDRTYYSHDENGVFMPETPVNDGWNSVDAKFKFFTPIHLYVTYPIVDFLTVGYGLNNPFGLGTYWPTDWDGRFVAVDTEIQTFFNQPTLAVDIAKLAGFKDSFKLSIAGGYIFVFGTAKLAKGIDLRVAEGFFNDIQGPEGMMRMSGHGMGHAWHASLYAELPGILALGASVRGGFASGGAIALPFSGDAKFSFNEGGQTAKERLSLKIPEKTTGEVTIDLPLHMNFGIAILLIDNLKIALDVYLARFESYDELLLKFACVEDEENPCTTLEQDPLPKHWGDSWQFSGGAEYMVTDSLALRLGFGVVTSPVPDDHYDPSLPDGFRYLFCGGAGYQGSWWKLDLGYMLAMWEDEKNNDVGTMDASGNPNGKASGTYTTQAHLMSLSFSMMF